MRLTPSALSLPKSGEFMMMTLATTGWFPDLQACVMATCPELTAIYRQPSINRQSAVNLIKDGKAVFPFLIVEVKPDRSADEWSRDLATYIQPVALHYVASNDDQRALIDSADPSRGYDVEQLVYDECQLLKVALIKWHGRNGAHGAFQCVPPWPHIDSATWSMPNQVALRANYPFYTGTVEAELLVGQSLP